MSETDPKLDATWRAASREQPPAALDDAIRAAARREVGAKPGGFGAAPRWWPLAAAATVAAIAVGIVQMTPPEQVTPTTMTAANNAATDVALRDVKPDTDKPSANQPQREAPSPAAAPEALRDASKPPAKEERRGAGDENDRGVLARNRSDSFAAPPKDEARDRAAAPEALQGANKSTAKERRLGAGSEDDRGGLTRQRSDSLATPPRAQFQEKKALDSRQEAPPQRVEEASERNQDLKQKAESAVASPPARPNAAASIPPASSAARNELRPFPATPAPAESGVSNAPPPMAAREPASAPASAPPPASAVAARKLAAQSSATGALSGNNAGSSVGKRAGNAELAPVEDATALEKRTAAMADKVTAERRKDMAPLAPDEWIKRIRRLIAEGKNEDAAKELLAFRREYKERSDALLPSDLRSFRQ